MDLKVRPIDVTRSNWDCSLEEADGKIAMRIGLRYVRGLQQIAAESLVQARQKRQFGSIEELARRVPELSRANLRMLAQIGALNNISADTKLHRRDALWQVEKAAQRVGKLLEGVIEQDTASPLARMDSGRTACIRLSRNRTDDRPASRCFTGGQKCTG